MIFRNREEAGQMLGESLLELSLDPVVLAIPRGGVVVAAQVARVLGASLDVIVPAKIRAPYQPELGIGAVAADGTRVLDEDAIAVLGVTEDYLAREIELRLQEIQRRAVAYRGDRPEIELAGRDVVIVDDGIATGWTARCAARSVRNRSPKSVILAVPVAPMEGVSRLEGDCDRVVCLQSPEPFLAVGRWYRDFDQVGDEEVLAALREVA
ncbi:MAG: phosphoribosyltransferase [Actinobacteria bacterium]|nr:phosphoribosyltransferase [Actinomycetota bacterium]